MYLRPRSELVDLRSLLGGRGLSSDALIPSFWRARELQQTIGQIPQADSEKFIRISYTIGGMMVWPGYQVDGKRTINQERGCHSKIRDRFDLTLECVRRHYVSESSPLGVTLARYADFFGLFDDFVGYVEFFHLQDLVNEATSMVNFFAPFEDFTGSPVPQTLDAYLGYRKRAIEFIESRNRRIAAYVAEHPPETQTQPVWASERVEAVLARAEAVGQRELLEELLAAGDRLGLYARPYVASVMFTPPKNRTRMLFTVWPETGGMRMWVPADTVRGVLPGDHGRRGATPAWPRRGASPDPTRTRDFIVGLKRLLHVARP